MQIYIVFSKYIGIKRGLHNTITKNSKKKNQTAIKLKSV